MCRFQEGVLEFLFTISQASAFRPDPKLLSDIRGWNETAEADYGDDGSDDFDIDFGGDSDFG